MRKKRKVRGSGTKLEERNNSPKLPLFFAGLLCEIVQEEVSGSIDPQAWNVDHFKQEGNGGQIENGRGDVINRASYRCCWRIEGRFLVIVNNNSNNSKNMLFDGKSTV